MYLDLDNTNNEMKSGEMEMLFKYNTIHIQSINWPKNKIITDDALPDIFGNKKINMN